MRSRIAVRDWIGQGRARCAALGALLLVLGAAAGCAERDVFWTRAESGEAEYQKTSASCTAQAERESAQEQRADTAGGGATSTGSGYGGVSDRRTSPNGENERRRLERRVRYHFGECMQARGWVRNTSGEGFKGL